MFVPQWLHQLQRSFFPPKSSKSRNVRRRPPVHRRVRLCLESLEDRLAPSADLVNVTAGNVSAPFSASQQNVTLTATVADATNSGTTVNEGTVSFLVKDSGGTTIGSASGTVHNGSTSASLALPAGEPAGAYTIGVSYSDGTATNFANGADNDGTLTVSAPTTTTVTNSPYSTAFSASDQPLTLSATVTSSTGTVDEGSVVFTVLQGTTVIGTATAPVNVDSNGKASATYTLPGGTDAGTYTVEAAYSDSSSKFEGSSGTGELDVTSATADQTKTAVVPPSAVTFNTGAQNVTLTATVSDTTTPSTTVNKGSVLFTLLDSKGNVIGTPISGNYDSTNNNFHVSYSLPPGTVPGSYTVEANYSDSSGTFAISSDTSQKLTVNAASTTTTASSTTATFGESDQTVKLTATVTSSGGTVNEGSVLFTLVNGSGATIGSPISGNVSSGSASVNYVLPGNTAAGSYTIKAAYTDSSPGNFTASSDNTHSLAVSAASTTTTATSATATFSTSNQNVTLSATVTSGAGTVDEGELTFTLVDSNGNTIGTATSSAVANGSASVSYVLPGGTAVGSYTIEAAYSDSAGNFNSSSDDTQTLTVNAANATTVSLTSVSITPNVSNGTAQVMLTAQVSNPNGTVNEGVVSFTVAGVSGQANVSNGTATVQLSVPLLSVTFGLVANLTYTDNSTAANFGSSTVVKPLSTSSWNALLPANLSFDASNNEQMQFTMASLPLFSELFMPNGGLLSQYSVGPVSLPVVYTNFGNVQVATVGGVPWGMILFDSNGNLQGIADVDTSSADSPQWAFYDSNHHLLGESPYGE
jgi:hypothetical protein